MKLSTLIASLCLVGSSAFMAPLPQRPVATLQMTAEPLSELDEFCIENVAELCLQANEALADECDLEEHEALINQLSDQKDLLQAHVNRMDNLLHRLKGDGKAKKEPEATYFAG